MTPTACTPESHAALKADPQRWAALPALGIRRYEYEDGDADILDHRNCPVCDTTLARVLDKPTPSSPYSPVLVRSCMNVDEDGSPISLDPPLPGLMIGLQRGFDGNLLVQLDANVPVPDGAFLTREHPRGRVIVTWADSVTTVPEDEEGAA